LEQHHLKRRKRQKKKRKEKKPVLVFSNVLREVFVGA
jgi:hypothetical protein